MDCQFPLLSFGFTFHMMSNLRGNKDIIQYKFALNKSIMFTGYTLVKERFDTIGKGFRDDLVYDIAKGYTFVILHGLWIKIFRDEGYRGGVDLCRELAISSREIAAAKISRPIRCQFFFVESRIKAIWTRRFV